MISATRSSWSGITLIRSITSNVFASAKSIVPSQLLEIAITDRRRLDFFLAAPGFSTEGSAPAVLCGESPEVRSAATSRAAASSATAAARAIGLSVSAFKAPLRLPSTQPYAIGAGCGAVQPQRAGPGAPHSA